MEKLEAGEGVRKKLEEGVKERLEEGESEAGGRVGEGGELQAGEEETGGGEEEEVGGVLLHLLT